MVAIAYCPCLPMNYLRKVLEFTLYLSTVQGFCYIVYIEYKLTLTLLQLEGERESESYTVMAICT